MRKNVHIFRNYFLKKIDDESEEFVTRRKYNSKSMKPIHGPPLLSPSKMTILKCNSTRFDEDEKILRNQGKFKTFLELRNDKKCKKNHSFSVNGVTNYFK